MKNKKLFIKTYGCQMNVYDSIKMAELLKLYGYEEITDRKDADMVILNTCHIREKAAEKMYSELGRIKKEKANDNRIIVVAGCVSQAEGDEIFKRASNVNIVVGPQSYHTLPDLLSRVNREKKVINLDFPEKDKFDALPEEKNNQGASAFLSVQEGCDKFCTFCVVPYTRGAEYSRDVHEIKREAIKLLDLGAKEISLLGQNVNAYHGKDFEGNIWSLGKLIKNLAELKDLKRIRYTTSHPRDMHQELYEAHQEIDKLMPFLHLPVQSGSNNILQAMNRKHSRDEYFKVIDNLKRARNDIQFSGDFIVGFPGETDQDFEDTLDLVRRVNYSQAYSFKYSPRPGTPGANIEEQVPEDVKSERLRILQELLNKQQIGFNESCIGKEMEVLFDSKGKYENQITGKTEFSQSVHVQGDEKFINEIKKVRILEVHPNSLRGELI